MLFEMNENKFFGARFGFEVSVVLGLYFLLFFHFVALVVLIVLFY